MASTAPETSWGLLAVDPYVAEPVAVVALWEAVLCLVSFDFYDDVTEVGKSEDSL